MLGIVLGTRVLHQTKAGNIISKLPVNVDGKKSWIYSMNTVETPDPKFDSLVPGQQVVLERDGNYLRITDDQTVTQGMGTQAQNVQAVFDGKVIEDKKLLDGDVMLRSCKLMASCIKNMRAGLPSDFTTEDCRAAGISLFIYLTKEFSFDNLPIKQTPTHPQHNPPVQPDYTAAQGDSLIGDNEVPF